MPEDISKMKHNKSASRRKRNKRRAKQRTAATINHNSAAAAASRFHGPTRAPGNNSGASNTRAMQLWREMYENAIKWQCEHQMNFWRQRAEHLEEENEALKRREKLEALPQSYETSSESEDEYELLDNRQQNTATMVAERAQLEVGDEKEESECAVDAEYLEFLAITHKHRAELKLMRQQEVATNV